jgi:hypothetical protein
MTGLTQDKGHPVGVGGDGFLWNSVGYVYNKDRGNLLCPRSPLKEAERYMMNNASKMLRTMTDSLSKLPRFAATEAFSMRIAPPSSLHEFLRSYAYDSNTQRNDRLVNESAG